MKFTDTKYAWIQSGVTWLWVGAEGATGADSRDDRRIEQDQETNSFAHL